MEIIAEIILVAAVFLAEALYEGISALFKWATSEKQTGNVANDGAEQENIITALQPTTNSISQRAGAVSNDNPQPGVAPQSVNHKH